MKKSLCLVLFTAIICVCCAGIISPATAASVPVADVTYTEDNNWEGTLEISQNITVKLSGLEHVNEGTTYRGSAIKISNRATVNLVIEGNVALKGNQGYISAGIEVETGSTLHLYGTDGSTLSVTGGKYSAGIGGIGYSSASTENSPAGAIIIHSGTILAVGGQRGAGIGSGYHSSASVIRIEGGDITAYGNECGAGIGSGYGTSGGAANDNTGHSTGSGVGYYSGGDITISGGTVRASADPNWSFDDFDPCDPATWPETNTHAAGIGGGYGARAGNIVIEGNAVVTAVGCSGGAGIGTGRGTSKDKNYDETNGKLNTITIRGSAQVTACSTVDSRSSQTSESGAAIGIGRGWKNGGTISIEGEAVVFAYAGNTAAAIGGARPVGDEYTADTITKPDSITIGTSASVTAINDGFVPAVHEPAGGNWVRVDLTDTEQIREKDTCPVSGLTFFKAGLAKNGEILSPEVKIPVDLDRMEYVMVQIPNESGGVFFTDGTYVLVNDTEDVICFFKPKAGEDLKVTDIIPARYDIVYHLNGGVNDTKNPDSYLIYTPAVKLLDAALEGSEFGGWYDNETLEGEAVTEIPTGSTGAKEFWAKWDEVSYTVSGTKGMTHTIGSGTDAVITVKRSPRDDRIMEYFRSVEVDGSQVPEKGNYTRKTASLELTLKSAYLDKLSVGEHTVKIVFSDGSAQATLKITRSTPKTGDRGNPVLWTGLMLLGLTGAALAGKTAVSRRKRK